MTFNIRSDQDTKPGRSWSDRRNAVLQLIQKKKCDFIAIQEAEYQQFRYLDTCLETFQSYGRGSGIANDQGEFCPIYWNFVKWKLMEGNVEWLSSTPNTPGSMDSSASKACIMTWCIFRHYAKGMLVLMINTH